MSETDDQRDVLLTGATGFLGGEVLVRLLAGDAPGGAAAGRVHLPVRAADDEDARLRVRGLLASLFGDAEPYAHRVAPFAADLTRPGIGVEEERRRAIAERVGRIIHCAASVSFDLAIEQSRAVNVGGTRAMLDLAELAVERGGIDSFVYISTAYVGGTHRGRFGEDELDVGQLFRNPYEQSKFEAEVLVRERAERTRAQILRPTIVVGDSETGWTRSFNVLYAPLRAFARGSLSILPARRSSPVDVVPVDYVADAVLALAGRPGTTYNLAAGSRASTVGELVELACDELEQPPPRIVPPALYRRLLHPLMLRRGSERRRRALRASEVFFPYYSMGIRYECGEARAALEPLGIEPPPLDSYFHRLVGFARQADWGRRPIARHLAQPPAARVQRLRWPVGAKGTPVRGRG